MTTPGATTRTDKPRETWTKAGAIVSHLPTEGVALQERAEASIGEPGAMGLFGFAVGTLLIAIPNAWLLPATTVAFVGVSAVVVNCAYQRTIIPLASAAPASAPAERRAHG